MGKVEIHDKMKFLVTLYFLEMFYWFCSRNSLHLQAWW